LQCQGLCPGDGASDRRKATPELEQAAVRREDQYAVAGHPAQRLPAAREEPCCVNLASFVILWSDPYVGSTAVYNTSSGWHHTSLSSCFHEAPVKTQSLRSYARCKNVGVNVVLQHLVPVVIEKLKALLPYQFCSYIVNSKYIYVLQRKKTLKY